MFMLDSRNFWSQPITNTQWGNLILKTIFFFAVQCQVSLKRINKFINSEELDPDAVSHDKATEAMVKAVNATYSWGDDLKPAIGKNWIIEISAFS